MRPLLVVGIGVALLTAHASAGPAPVDSRVIVGFDRQPETWLVNARTRLLPALGPTPVWSLTGRVGCVGDGCPGRLARLKGVVRAPDGVVYATARFARGTTCTFAGSLGDPSAAGDIICTNRDGGITLRRPIHVGVCRCVIRGHGADAFCATSPCPF
jgi:hypothetical protein